MITFISSDHDDTFVSFVWSSLDYTFTCFWLFSSLRRLVAACSVLRFSSRFSFSAGFIEPPRYRFKRRRAPAISSSYHNCNFSEYYFVSHWRNIQTYILQIYFICVFSLFSYSYLNCIQIILIACWSTLSEHITNISHKIVHLSNISIWSLSMIL